MRTEGRPEQVRAPAREPLTSEGDFVVAVDLAFNFERKLEGGRGLYPMRVSSPYLGLHPTDALGAQPSLSYPWASRGAAQPAPLWTTGPAVLAAGKGPGLVLLASHTVKLPVHRLQGGVGACSSSSRPFGTQGRSLQRRRVLTQRPHV